MIGGRPIESGNGLNGRLWPCDTTIAVKMQTEWTQCRSYTNRYAVRVLLGVVLGLGRDAGAGVHLLRAQLRAIQYDRNTGAVLPSSRSAHDVAQSA